MAEIQFSFTSDGMAEAQKFMNDNKLQFPREISKNAFEMIDYANKKFFELKKKDGQGI